jgi:hypothetical protein
MVWEEDIVCGIRWVKRVGVCDIYSFIKEYTNENIE